MNQEEADQGVADEVVDLISIHLRIPGSAEIFAAADNPPIKCDRRNRRRISEIR